MLLLHGAGKVFVPAPTLQRFWRHASHNELHAMLTDLMEVLRRFERGPLPVIAAVHGLALAGGLEMMMGCDVVFAARSAKIGDQHAQYGLVPGGGNSQRLTRVLGRRRALDLMFSARWLGAEEALEWGLVNYVVEDEALLDEAMAYAKKVASHSAVGLATMKQMVDDGIDMSQDRGLAYEVDPSGGGPSDSRQRRGAQCVSGKDAHLSLPSAQFELGAHRATPPAEALCTRHLARKASVSAAEYVERRDIWLRDR